MKKIDKAILRETLYVCAFTVLFSVVMQMVFLIFFNWDFKVLCGNLLGGIAGALNFFLLGLTVQRATRSGDVKYAKNVMKLSQMARMIFLFAVGIVGAVLHDKCFNVYAVLISLFFPRIALLIRPFFFTKAQRQELRAQREQEKESDVIEEE